jgi:lipopolysaccharide transport system ATP-binding protein
VTESKKNEPIVEVKHLSKQYNISANGTYKMLRDSLTLAIKNPLKMFKSNFKENNTFWALKDVNFEIKRGEIVGIIGKNGAGKSTLLKILSRITYPTEGEVRMRGRVGSLLEVGTGFHPELSGRENVYFNGAILGMRKREIDQKFEEIVKFSGVEKFLDTPVKRYSSGMQVRLAFSVAANLDPEILVVDEVLAVGDAQFQKKCLGKMSEVAEGGRTVLFVSHNMSAIESLCNRGILLESGSLSLDSSVEEVVNVYLEKAYNLAKEIPLEQRKDRSGSGKVRVSNLRYFNEMGKEETFLKSGNGYFFEIECINFLKEKIDNIFVSLDFFDERHSRVLLLRSNFTNSMLSLMPGKGSIFCTIKDLPLANGIYQLSVFISHADTETLDYIEDIGTVTVDGGDFFGTGSYGLPNSCKVLVRTNWTSNEDQLFNDC